jgi:BirA family biotin operon repressor/biotin-[acetyl-CoA-carboxylase] ligase
MSPALLPPAAPRWDAEALWLALQPLLPGLSVEVVASCPSTNTVLLERARRAASTAGDAGDRRPCLLVAEHQSHGRGRLGRQWQSSPGASLTFSLALPLQPADWSGLSLAVGVALADALDPAEGGTPRIALKWPNDLWLRDGPGAGRKLGGVLIETVPMDDRRVAVVGVGLNVQPQSLDGLGSGYASLHELDAGATAPAALHRVVEPLVRALLAFERHGFAPLAPAFAARDLLLGQPVTTTQPGLPEGIAAGVAPDGALLLNAGGLQHRLTSGEVSVRPQPTDARA